MDYVVVYSANGKLEAETVRLFLEANGFEVLLSQESYGVTLGLTIGPMGEAKILVPESQVERANAILKEMEEGKFEDQHWDEDVNSELTDDEISDLSDYEEE